jgi:hypothetical protein
MRAVSLVTVAVDVLVSDACVRLAPAAVAWYRV